MLKKLIKPVLALAMAASLSACFGGEEDNAFVGNWFGPDVFIEITAVEDTEDRFELTVYERGDSENRFAVLANEGTELAINFGDEDDPHYFNIAYDAENDQIHPVENTSEPLLRLPSEWDHKSAKALANDFHDYLNKPEEWKEFLEDNEPTS
jgi:hypothetical protein